MKITLQTESILTQESILHKESILYNLPIHHQESIHEMNQFTIRQFSRNVLKLNSNSQFPKFANGLFTNSQLCWSFSPTQSVILLYCSCKCSSEETKQGERGRGGNGRRLLFLELPLRPRSRGKHLAFFIGWAIIPAQGMILFLYTLAPRRLLHTAL